MRGPRIRGQHGVGHMPHHRPVQRAGRDPTHLLHPVQPVERGTLLRARPRRERQDALQSIHSDTSQAIGGNDGNAGDFGLRQREEGMMFLFNCLLRFGGGDVLLDSGVLVL